MNNRRADVRGHAEGDERFAAVDTHIRKTRHSQDQLIQTLHVAQDIFGHLSHDLMAHVATELRLPPSTVYSVATFYHLFRLDPPGEHQCTVCTGTACFVKGSESIVGKLSAEYGLAPGQTTDDGRLTLRTARCLGSCGLAPVTVLDGRIQAHQTPEGTLEQVGRMLDPHALLPEPADEIAPDDGRRAV
ncbi:MAG: bidirectional [NiFe] hydrogenase diaphorase subunit [Actinomycetota bacterium]|nr:bidirectional [NiFe] hydrogenase diaphorase subunit [Actinomycetota bacterium]